ncbi:MAG TPA: ABC transporter permease [Bryobacteraceae bacterium]|nr:ABC transporter permease [Bryobacteraceae bacterium]
MRKIASFLRNSFRKKCVEQDLDDEIRFYLETTADDKMASGMSEDEARRAAQLHLGNTNSLKDSVRDIRTGAMVERIWQDFRYACRDLRHKPVFTGAAVLILALGIGATSAVFSLINAFLLKPLAVTKPEELVGLYSRDTKHPDAYRAFSYPNYLDIRDSQAAFSSMTAHDLALVGIKEGDKTRRTFADVVSSDYFSTLGVTLFAGRPFGADEEKPGRDLTVIVSYSFWRKTGGDPQLIGKHLRINDHLFTVIGITPKGFTGTTVLASPELYVPLGAYDFVMNDIESHGKPLDARDNNALILVGRLRRGLTLEAANAGLAVVASQMAKAFPAENKDQMLSVHPLSRLSISTDPSSDNDPWAPAILLLALAAVVLLIASLNLASLMMAKGAVRRKEIAIRLAIGGSRRRIVQQLVTEGLLLAVLGGAVGLFVASWSTTVLIGSLSRVAPIDLVYDSTPDARLLAGTLVFCGMSAVIFALFPAWKLSKPKTWLDLKENAGEDAAGRARHLFSRGNILVIAQLSLSLMMLGAAGLFIRSAAGAANVQPGFSLDNEIVGEVDASLANQDEARGRQAYRALLEHLRQIPGVQSVSMAATVPFGETFLGTRVLPSNSTASEERRPMFARLNIVANGYFQTLGVPLLRGRSFVAAENMPESRSHVAVVDKLAADKLWPGGNAVGQQIRLDRSSGGYEQTCEVVGVVGNVREKIVGDGAKPTPHVYIPFGQHYQADMQIHVRVAASLGDAGMLDTIRREIRAADPHLPLLSLKTMHGHLESGPDIWVVRTGAHILEIFGGVALFLAIIGLYAVNAYTVARRTREIGIRMAIGADATSTLRMILSEGLRITAVAVGLGLLLALGIGQVLTGFLYEVRAIEPVVLLVAAALLTAVALVACYIPARKASLVDPMIALRHE